MASMEVVAETSPVKLVVYDLSNGMAAHMSAALIGQRIEGIWHTGRQGIDKKGMIRNI
jgi:hypothetical protein